MKRNSILRSASGASSLTALQELLTSRDARAPLADVSNAGFLMGDVVDGEDVYGDTEDVYGDVSTAALDVYNTLIGDADEDEIGAPRRRRRLLGPTGKKIALGVGIAGGATAAGIAIARAAKRNKQRRQIVKDTEARNAALNTIQNQVMARQLLGKIPRNAKFPFYQITGANLNAFPLVPTETFAANDLKFNLDLQSTQTPFESEIVAGAFAGVTWTLTANGVATARFYPCVLITVGISTLTANPGTIFTVQGTFPLVNAGTLVVAGNPWSFTLASGWYAKLIIFPWVLVTNRATLALGSYDNANPIVVTITGLPANATTNMIVPGSQHPWTIGMRNAMV